MKGLKFLFSFFLILSGAFVFAESGEELEEKWANFSGMGVMGAYYNHDVRHGGGRKSVGTLFDFSEVVVNMENGLTLRADWGVFGEVSCDDVDSFGDGRDTLNAMDFSCGVGYSFIRTKTTSLSLCGIFGFSWHTRTKNCEYEFGGKKFDELEYSAYMFGVGLNLGLQKKIGEHFGFFANAGVRYQFYGEEKISYSDGHETETAISYTNDIFGKIAVIPALGFSWSF